MQTVRFNIQDTLLAVARLAARLLGQERHRVALIQQAQLAFRVARGARVEINPAFQQVTVEIRHQRTDIPRGIRALGRFIFFLAIFDVLLHAHREFNVIPFVNGVRIAAGREAHTLLAQAEYAKRRIVGKGMHAAAGGIHQHGGGAVNHITRSNLLAARLQEIFHRDRRPDWRHAAIDRENGADRDVDINVRRAIQRIHQDDILRVFAAFENDNLVFFFGGDARHDIACLKRGFELFIGEQIEFLLRLALYVFDAAGTQDIDQTGLIDIAVDDLSAKLYCRQQRRQFPGGVRKFVLLFDNKFT
ncbi:hypothetical protein BN132_1856 [Cronobacter turicensis 564]|nr:hypothetical protein BN132_1856 [Cronobacter turicensis 564]